MLISWVCDLPYMWSGEIDVHSQSRNTIMGEDMNIIMCQRLINKFFVIMWLGLIDRFATNSVMNNSSSHTQHAYILIMRFTSQGIWRNRFAQPKPKYHHGDGDISYVFWRKFWQKGKDMNIIKCQGYIDCFFQNNVSRFDRLICDYFMNNFNFYTYAIEYAYVKASSIGAS